MIEIKDLSVYNNEMDKVLEEKLFFIDKIPDNITVFFDYGCGDGSLLKAIKERRPDVNCIGYDQSEDMIIQAQQDDKNCVFSSNLIDLMEELRVYSKSCIILSSVLHEIHSYLHKEIIDYFYEFLFNFHFDYIVIRDMSYTGLPNIKVDSKYLRAVTSKAISLDYQKELNDFIKEWGGINYCKNFVHFLLKYRYKANWDREVKEDYFAFNADEFLKERKTSNYKIIYSRFFILPWFKKHIKDVFNIDLQHCTHAEIILQYITQHNNGLNINHYT